MWLGDEQSAESIRPPITITTGNRGTFVGANKFFGINEFISKYIRRYSKPMNIRYIRRFGRGTDEYIGHTGWLWPATYIHWWDHVTDEYIYVTYILWWRDLTDEYKGSGLTGMNIRGQNDEYEWFSFPFALTDAAAHTAATHTALSLRHTAVAAWATGP
jgi:hypothetical protein